MRHLFPTRMPTDIEHELHENTEVGEGVRGGRERKREREREEKVKTVTMYLAFIMSLDHC